MAPTKTTKEKVPLRSKETQAKDKEHAALTAALQAAKKSEATQAKDKENAASTAALQAKKKKNQLRNDSGLGILYHAPNDSSTTMSRHLLSIPRIPHCFGQYEHS